MKKPLIAKKRNLVIKLIKKKFEIAFKLALLLKSIFRHLEVFGLNARFVLL